MSDHDDDQPPDVELLTPGAVLRKLRPGLWTVELEHEQWRPAPARVRQMLWIEAGYLAELLAKHRAPVGIPVVITDKPLDDQAAAGVDAGNVPGTPLPWYRDELERQAQEQEGTG